MAKLLVLALLLSSIDLYSQQKQQDEKNLVPYSFDGNKWGYVDIDNWNANDDWDMVIPAKYDEAFPFYDGLARVKENNKYEYINKKGESVTAPDCDHTDDLKANGDQQKAQLTDLNLKDTGHVTYYECPKNSLNLLRIKLNWGK